MRDLSEMRIEKGLSEQKLALLVGVAEEDVRSWESGSIPPSGCLLRLAAALGVEVEEILEIYAVPANGAGAEEQETAERRMALFFYRNGERACGDFCVTMVSCAVCGRIFYSEKIKRRGGAANLPRRLFFMFFRKCVRAPRRRATVRPKRCNTRERRRPC